MKIIVIPPDFHTATPMFNVTGSAGSARLAALLQLISICIIDMKDYLLFGGKLKLYVLHSVHSDTAAQKDRNWITCVCLEIKQSFGGIKMMCLTVTH